MSRTEEERYTDLLRRIAVPSTIDADGLAAALREVERLHSMGHLSDGQLEAARDAYAATVERDPRHGAPRSAETRADERD
jgi:hypothetical protein